MGSKADYLTFVLELLRDVRGITYKKMMGEYILYKDGVIFGGIYDNQFLVKKTESSMSFKLREEIPYPGAKPMLLVDSEDSNEIAELVLRIYKDLKK